MMLQVANYLSTHETTELAKHIKSERQAMNFRRSMDAELLGHKLKPDPGFTSPTQTTLKRQYRASYPPLRPKTQDSSSHNGSVTTTSTIGDLSSPNRPRRSSLRQSSLFDGPPSESPSAKQVRFNFAETIYEPFDAKDANTIDQILGLLRVASRKVPVESSIPLSSSHSVAYRHNEAVREHAVLIVPSRDSAIYVQPQRVEYVNRPSRSRSQSQRKSHSQSQSRTSSRSNANEQARSPRVRDDRVRLVSNMRRSSSQSSHHRSNSHASPRSHRDDLSGERKRANRTSSGSDKTLVNDSEMSWAPATSVLYAKECGRNPSNNDEDQPIIVSPKESNSLRRSDAQYQAPAPRRRHRLLQGLTRMFE